MQAVYGDKCVNVSTIRHWVQHFKQDEVGEVSMFDKARLGGQWLQLTSLVKNVLKKWPKNII